MKWMRAEIPDNVSKTTSDVYKDFYESQDLVEKNTPIYLKVRNGEIKIPSEELALEMFEFCRKFTQKKSR